MASDRKTIRGAIASGLSGAVTGAQSVYAYQPADLASESPVVTVVSTGSRRVPFTPQGIASEFLFDINVFVVRSAKEWTEQNAEDKLDEIEQQIAAWVEDNKGNTTNWGSLEYAERTTVSLFTPQGGDTYLWERIPIIVQVYG